MGATVKEIPTIGVGAGAAANAEDGRIPCSSGDCNSGGPPDFLGGCSNGVCTGTDGTAHDCLCACIPPDAPQSCPAAAMVNKMSTMELATVKEIPAIGVGAGVAANAEDGRIPCSSGDCYSGGPPDFLGGCSNGVCTGTDGTAHDCLCACIPPDAPQSCPA